MISRVFNMNIFNYAELPSFPTAVFSAKLQKPAGLSDNWLEPTQRNYTSEEHHVWDLLYKRQMDILPGRACDSHDAGKRRILRVEVEDAPVRMLE